jgi:hypothetical protein
MWSIQTMKYYPALNRDEILTGATTCMNFENIMQSEIRQTQKDKHCMSPLIWRT